MIDDANDTIIKELFEDTLDHIQSGGLYAIPEILILVSKIASRVDAHLLQEFLSLAKPSVFDLRRNVQFWPAFTGEASHVAGRLPLPGKNGTKIRVHFFETLYPYENKMSIKKISSMDKKVTC